MKLTGDYHTHTTFSHGKGSILENALAGKEFGLKEIGISDHGFAHPAFGLTKKKVPIMRKECDEASKRTGIKVLLGIESNIIGVDGTVDLKSNLYDNFDIFLAGMHKFVKYKFSSFFSWFIPDFIYSTFKANDVPNSLRKRNTRAFINVIKKNPVDVITHLNYCCFADAEEVAKVASDYGTYIELNSKKIHLTDEEIEKVLKTDVRFVISSDAHSTDRVGDNSLVKSMVDRTGFPLDRIDNIDGRLPNFRFKNFKEKGQ